ncbi:uncharacterized protein LOC144926116 isoform X2 [Branchiostoma floridae x Branchiostoma belcheri]
MAIEQDEPPTSDNVVETSVYSADVATGSQEEVSGSQAVKTDVYNVVDHEIPEPQQNGGHFDSSRSDESLLYVGDAGLKTNASSDKAELEPPVNSEMDDSEPSPELEPPNELSTQQQQQKEDSPMDKEATGTVQTMDEHDGINNGTSTFVPPVQERPQPVYERKVYDRSRASFPPPPPDYETAITRCVRLDPNPAGFVLMPRLPVGYSPVGPGQGYPGDFSQHGGVHPPHPSNGFAPHEGHFQQESGHDRMRDAPFEQELYRHEPGFEQFSSLPPYSHEPGSEEVGYPSHEDRHFDNFHSRQPHYGSAENILDMQDPPVPLSEMSPQLSNSAMDITEHGRNARSTDRKSALAGFLNRRKNLSGSWGSRARQPRQSASSVFAGSAESLPDPQEDTSLRTMSLDRLNRQKPTSKRTYGIRSSSLDRMLDEDGNDLGDTDEAAQEEETPLRTASLDRLDRQRTPQSRRRYGFKSTSLQQPSDNDPGSFDENGEHIPEGNNEDKTPQRTAGSLDRLNRQGSAYDRASRVKAASLEEFRQSLRSLTLKKPTGIEGDQQQEQEHAEHHEERQVTTPEPTQKTPVRKNLTPFIKFSPAFLEKERSKQVMPASPTPAMTVTDGQQSRLDDARQKANQLEELLKSKRQKMEEAKKQVRKIHQNLEDELTKQDQSVTDGSSREDESVVIDFSKPKDGDKNSKQSEETARENGWSTTEFGRDSVSKPSNHEDTENKKGASDDLSTEVGSKVEETFKNAKKLLLRTDGSHRDQPVAPSFISFEGGDDQPVTPPPFSNNDPLPELLAPPNDFNPGNPFDLFLDSLGLPVMQEEWIEERRPSLSTIYEEDEPLSDSTANSSVIDLTVDDGSTVGEDSKDERGMEEEDKDEKALNVQEVEVKEKAEDSHIEERQEGDDKEKMKDEKVVEKSREDAKQEDVTQATKEDEMVDGKEEKLKEETVMDKVDVSLEPQGMTGTVQDAQENVSEDDKKMEATAIDVTDGDEDSVKKETANNTRDRVEVEPIDSVNHIEKKDKEERKDDIPVKEFNNVTEGKDGTGGKMKEKSEIAKVGQPNEQKTSEVREEEKALSSNDMVEEEKPQLIEKETHPEEEEAESGIEDGSTPEKKDEAKKVVTDTPSEGAKEEDTDAAEATANTHDDVGEQSKETSENEDKHNVQEPPKVPEDTVSIHTEEVSKEETKTAPEKIQDSSIQKENNDISNKSEAIVKENPKKMPVVEITVNLKASEIGPDLLHELVAAKSPTGVAPPPPNVSKSPKVSKKTYQDKTKQNKGTAKSSKEKDKSKKNKNFMEEINALLEQTESTMVRRSTEITSVSEDLQNTAKTLFNLEVEETVFTASPNTTGSSHDLSGSVSSLDSTTEEDKGQTSVTSPERHPVKGPEHQSSATTPERQSDSGNGSLNDSPFSVRADTLDKSPSPVEPFKEDIKTTEQATEEEKEQEPAKEQPTEALETKIEATDVSEKDKSKDGVSESSAMESLQQKEDTEKETIIPSDDTNHKDDMAQNETDTTRESSERDESPSQKLESDKDITETSKEVSLQHNLKQEEPETKSDESKPSLEKENPSQKLETDDETTNKLEETNLEQDTIQEEHEMMRNETMPHAELKTKSEITKGADKLADDSPNPNVTEHHFTPNGKVSSESTEQERRHTSTSRVEMNVILMQDKEANAAFEETNKNVASEYTKNENDLERRDPDIISDMPKVARSVELFESLLKSDNQNKKDRITRAPIPSNKPARDEVVDATKDEVQPGAKTEQKQTTVEPESQKDYKQETSNTQLPVPVDEEGEVIEGIYTASLVYVGGSSFEESGSLSPRKFQTSESFEVEDNIPVFSPTDKSTPARDGIFKAQLVQVSSLSFEEDPEESIGSEDSSNASITSSSPSYELVRDEKGWKGKPRHSTPTGQEDSTSPGPEDSSLRRGRSMRRRSQRKSFEGSLWDDEDFKHKPVLLRQDSPPHKQEPIRSPEVDTSKPSQKTTTSPKLQSIKDFFRRGKKRSSSAHKATTKNTSGSEDDKLDSLPSSILVERASQSDGEDEPKGGLNLFYRASKTKL